MKKIQDHRSYVASFDGLRSLAIILVLLYHFNIPLFSGGFIGVDIFFVLSGYLITSKLLSEWQGTRKIDLKNFWIKRFRRLVPAVLVMIIVTLIIIYLFYPEVFSKSWPDALASFFYLSNWWYIVNDIPYSQNFGISSPFKHLWSLAIEEQFYIIWPVIFAWLLQKLKKRQHVLKVVLVTALCSIVTMWVLYSPDNIDRIYYGTDTRLFTLAFGCSLAFVWPFYLLSDNLNKKEVATIDGIGSISLAGLLFLAMTVTTSQKSLYHGGFLFISFLSCMLLAALAHPSTKISKLFSHEVLVWIGKRSYSIYLWHFPVIALTTPVKTMGTVHPILIILQLILILFLANISYHVIEIPVIKLGFKQMFLKIKENSLTHFRKNIVYVGIVLCLIISLGSYSNALVNGHFFFQTPNAKIMKKSTSRTTEEKRNKPKTQINQVIALGDSVLLGVKDEFEKEVPGVIVDAKVGRQLVEAKELIQTKYQKYNRKDTVVFLELGSNSTFNGKILDDIIQSLDNSHIFLVNTKVPREWETEVNEMLLQASQKYKHVTLIDWNALAKQQPYILNDDGIHISPEFKENYLSLYLTALNQFKLNLSKTDT